MNILELATEDQRDDGHQLDKDVESGSRSILEGISNSVSDYSCLMDISSFADHVSVVVLHSTAFDVLLGVIPSTSSVSSRNSHLHSAHDSSGQEASKNLGTEGQTEEER